MGLGQKIIDVIEKRRDHQRKRQSGAIGQFWCDKGNKLLYDMPVITGSLVIDAGGYEGAWTSEMISRYGCKSQIYEPVPQFAAYCENYFKNNQLVSLHRVALGAADRKTNFFLLDDGTSEFNGGIPTQQIEVDVIDVARVFTELAGERVACFKLNIEGGEYELLERLLSTNNAKLCGSLLIQFHRQPEGYKDRYQNIVADLRKTHVRNWCYEMVWEKWTLKDSHF